MLSATGDGCGDDEDEGLRADLGMRVGRDEEDGGDGDANLTSRVLLGDVTRRGGASSG